MLRSEHQKPVTIAARRFDSYGCMGTATTPDEALLLSGDLEDFGLFYDRYVTALLAFFQRRTGDPEAAADLTAETFAAAMVSRRRYQPRGATAAGWLFAIAHHKLTDFRRRGRPRRGCARGSGWSPYRSAPRTRS